MGGEDRAWRPARRDLLMAGGAVIGAAALPGALRATGPDAPFKVYSIVMRKAGSTPAQFRTHWIDVHGTMAKTVPGIGGFILSEPIAGGAANPDQPFGEIDGIACSWWPNRSGMTATMASAEARAWLADGDLFIERAPSRNFMTRETMVVPIGRGGSGYKRTMLLVRKPGTTHAQFMAHWTGRHAALARGIPGLEGYVTSTIESSLGGSSSPWDEIDGIAETWWDGAGAERGGRVQSPAADAWSADAAQFLDLTRSRLIVSREHVMIPVTV